jgi:hypothetical protein
MSKHIVIVDDNETCRKVTLLFLESRLGLEVRGEEVDGVDAVTQSAINQRSGEGRRMD